MYEFESLQNLSSYLSDLFNSQLRIPKVKVQFRTPIIHEQLDLILSFLMIIQGNDTRMIQFIQSPDLISHSIILLLKLFSRYLILIDNLQGK